VIDTFKTKFPKDEVGAEKRLNVRVIKGKGLTERVPLACTVRIGKRKRQVKSIGNSHTPVFNEQVEFSFPSSERASKNRMRIAVSKNQTYFREGQCIGFLDIDMAELVSSPKQFSQASWYNLTPASNTLSLGFCAQLQLQFSWTYTAHERIKSLSKDQISKIPSSKLFQYYDLDQSGGLDRDEFRAMACTLGYYFDEESFSSAFAIIDQDGSGQIDMNEFVEFWGKPKCWHLLKLTEESKDRIRQIAEYFSYFDKYNTGSLSEFQFREMYNNMVASGYALTEFSTLWNALDRNQDGFIHFNELLNYVIKRGFLGSTLE